MKGFISEKELLNLWEKKLSSIRDEESFNLYIDNPFCVQQCAYCKHTGSLKRDYEDDFSKYYEEILPAQIKIFSSLLKKKIPDTVYFGGGTPSAMSFSQMKNVFSSIPNFKKIKKKAFECNPNLLNKEKIKLLIENNFTYVSFGIQSLDKDVLDYNRRDNYEKIPLKDYIGKFEKEGVRVNCDLMAFIGEYKDNPSIEIKRVEKDIVGLVKTYRPSMITIYPESGFLREDKIRGAYLSRKLREMILKLDKKHNFGHQDEFLLSLNKDDILRGMEICYHLGVSLSSEELRETKKYDSSGPPNQSPVQNCLALGGFKHHRPWSYHGRDFVYHNLNEENTGFSYFITGEKEKKRPVFTNMDFI